MKASEVRSRIAESRMAPLVAMGPRARIGLSHLGAQSRHVAQWFIRSREHTNFTYDLTPNNVEQLVWFVCAVTNRKVDEVQGYVQELLSDAEIRSTYIDAVTHSTRRGLADRQLRFGRRLAWYALVRSQEPGLVVETGTDKGLGSLVLASALIRNGSGRLITLDINPSSGYLIQGQYREVTSVLRGDSLALIEELPRDVDFFLHDSDHTPEHERREFELITPHLSDNALVVSDNAHVTPVLAQWARSHGRRYLFFAEQPEQHWYRGAGVGVAWS